ncbi:hypothetical protein GBAR_LOCUS6484 [Geodia barretti]|uniref:T9SS type A sorting domain-containing protein n=1 Tax=Geodia barretti TaxID=519541 RepID=A0AA35RG58_GEOBA|nr:hypothetical protein GBAR_LOCUS6484 [Geodia barretti]
MNYKECLMKDQLFNRKILFSLLAVVMCLGFTAMSYGQAVVSVDPAEVESPAVGEELMVNINIAGGAGVAGYQVTVNFDPTALSYVSGGNADYLPAGAFAVPATTTDSSVTIAGTSLTGPAPDGDGTLATVTFTVVEAKPSAISLTDLTLADATANALDATTMDGMVTVAGAEPAPAEEAPAEEPAAEEAPAEETPAEEPVAEEVPAEEVAPEMPVSQMFEITLTNLTTGEPGAGGQVLSPPIFVTHAAGINLAEVGQPASPALVALAENGDASGLVALAAAAGANSMVAEGVVPPGGSLTVTVTADMVNSSLSVGSMLVSTNDAFIAATDVALFDEDGAPVSASLDLNAYDAGSEENTEMASDIPGPLALDAAVDPEGSNERVPTEGGVIAAHEGIQGGADVGEAFAWDEPTAMLMITPVEAPAEPVVEEPIPEPVVEGPGFDVTLEPGLNMVSIPLMPADPYTAKSLAEMLGATVVIQLDAATQSFTGYTVADEGDGFGIDGGKGYIVNTPAGGMVKFTGDAWDNQPEPEEAPAEEAPAEEVAEEPAAEEEAPAEEVAEEPAAEEEAPAEEVAEEPAAEEEAPAEEVAEEPAAEEEEAPAAPALSTYKSAWAFIVTSDIQGMDTGTAYTLVAENLRTGVIATENVTNAARRSSAVWADLNRKSVVEAGDRLKVALYDDRGSIVSGPFQRTVTTMDIRNAFLSLQLNVGDVQPQDTLLAQNFPNPFNPETWIPYQLSKATEVKIDIYDISGHLVRSLDLGWKPLGSYMTPSGAAYWDGKNAVGERVASGIYFYTLQTSDFAATRRMVILK